MVIFFDKISLFRAPLFAGRGEAPKAVATSLSSLASSARCEVLGGDAALATGA